MKLIKLIIEYSEQQLGLFPQLKSISYDFQGDKVLITSENENSKGKTTLIRFILYALGYKITQTDGMSIYDYKTTLEIDYKGKKYFFVRNRDKISFNIYHIITILFFSSIFFFCIIEHSLE